MVIENDSRKIKFCSNILQVMKKYIQQDDNSLESGGILLGRENAGNTNLIIEFITEPMPGDKSSRRRFFVKILDIFDFLKKYMKIVKEYIDISVNGILILKIFHVIHLLILKIGKKLGKK